MFKSDDWLIDEIYAAVTSPGGFAALLDLLVARFDAQSGVFVLSDQHRQIASLQLCVGHMAEPALLQTYAEIAASDPAPAAFQALAVGEASSTFALFGPEHRAKQPFYQEFYLKQARLMDFMGVNVVREPNRTSVLGVQRAADATPFSQEDIASLQRLTPHLQRAVRLHRHFAGLVTRNDSLAALLNRIGAPAVLLDANRRVHATSPAADHILAAADGLTIGHAGVLHLSDAKAAAQLADAVAAAILLPGAAQAAISVRRPSGQRAYTAQVSRFMPLAEGGPALALVLVNDPAGAIPQSPALAQLFGFTPRETALAHSLLHGLSLEQHAAAASTTINTTKTQLRAALQKTGARNQSDLIRILLTALPRR